MKPKSRQWFCYNSKFHALWRSSDRNLITMKRYLWPYVQFAYANYSKSWLTKGDLLCGSLDKTCSRGGIWKLVLIFCLEA